MTEVCKTCGKPPLAARAGSVTSYFFQHNYCRCHISASLPVSENRFGAALKEPSEPVCGSCGKARPGSRRAGSFTAYLFKELRCQCSGPSGGRGKRTGTAERVSQKRQFTESLKSSDNGLRQTIFSRGDIIGGTFRIISIVGEGGMGIVYLADHAALNRRFALKVLSPELVNEQNWLRFQSEAKTLGGLNHPIFVRVYDLGIHNQSVPFYSMDFVNGRSLEEILVEDGPMPFNEALDIFVEVLDGLAYAHRNGIVHRDIKPGNIMICTVDGASAVKILDFGISKLMSSGVSGQSLTSTGEVFGSPFYMSPEQCVGGHVDSRSDIYSIGCTLFEVLCGFVPYEGRTALETVLMHQESDPPQVSDFNPKLKAHPAIDTVISRCLAKLPQDRYQSAKELSLDLIRVREGKEILSYSRSLFEKEHGETVIEESKNPRATILLVALLAFLLAVGGYFCWRLSQPDALYTGRQPEISAASDPMGDVDKMVGDVASPESFFGVADTPLGSQNDSTPYGSTERRGKELYRIFDCPRDCLIGYFCQYDYSANQAARGIVSFPISSRLVFNPTRTLVKFPQYISRFRPGELAAFKIYNLENSDQLLEACSLRPEIEELRLESNKHLTAACIPSLNKFSNLKIIKLNDVELTGSDLSQADCWKGLTRLEFNKAHKPTPFLKKIGASPTLMALSLKGSRAGDTDYQIISEMPALQDINLSGNPMSVKQLTVLSVSPVDHLNIHNCGLNESAIPALKKFSKLKNLTIMPSRKGEVDDTYDNLLAALKYALPGVAIE